MASSNGEDILTTMEFISDRERVLFAEARLGEAVRDFLASEVGSYLHGVATQEYEEAKSELMELDPDLSLDYSKEVAKIRSKAWNAEHFMSWLADLIQQGDNSYNLLQEERDQ